MSKETPAYERILLKLSGEALMGSASQGIEPAVIRHFAEQIKTVVDMGVQVGLVIGGGNIFRGAGLAEAGMDRVTGDQMGMLATVMNALAMKATLDQIGAEARVMSAMPIGTFCEPFSRDQAVSHLKAGRVVIFSGGTGNPFFTTDSAASLRAIEIGADVMIKATKVDGVYSADPVKVPDAVKYDTITYDEALAQKLNVMDATAIVLCRDHAMPLRVFNINQSGALERLLAGEAVGTLVERGE